MFDVISWHPIETIPDNQVVLLYSQLWIDPDFNPRGIREGFKNGEPGEGCFNAAWNDCSDAWMTLINNEATHWMYQPETPQ